VHFIYLTFLYHKTGQVLDSIITLASLTSEKHEPGAFIAMVAPLFSLDYSMVPLTFHSNLCFKNSNLIRFPSTRQFPYLFQQWALRSYSISFSKFLPNRCTYPFTRLFGPYGFPSIFLFRFRLIETFHIAWWICN